MRGIHKQQKQKNKTKPTDQIVLWNKINFILKILIFWTSDETWRYDVVGEKIKMKDKILMEKPTHKAALKGHFMMNAPWGRAALKCLSVIVKYCLCEIVNHRTATSLLYI